jgi:hypothetical protein
MVCTKGNPNAVLPQKRSSEHYAEVHMEYKMLRKERKGLHTGIQENRVIEQVDAGPL